MTFRIFLLAMFVFATAHAGGPIIVPGGLSPTKQFAVAIYVKKNVDVAQDDDDPAVYAVYLIDGRTRKKIGPLEETSCDGGGYGTTTENVSAKWSADGRWLAVQFRAGRAMYGFQLYEVAGRRAIPVTLPNGDNLRKGKFLSYVTTTANPSEGLSFLSNDTLVVSEHGLRIREDAPDDIDKQFGLGGFDGDLEKVYHLSKSGRWVMADIRLPKDPQ